MSVRSHSHSNSHSLSLSHSHSLSRFVSLFVSLLLFLAVALVLLLPAASTSASAASSSRHGDGDGSGSGSGSLPGLSFELGLGSGSSWDSLWDGKSDAEWEEWIQHVVDQVLVPHLHSPFDQDPACVCDPSPHSGSDSNSDSNSGSGSGSAGYVDLIHPATLVALQHQLEQIMQLQLFASVPGVGSASASASGVGPGPGPGPALPWNPSALELAWRLELAGLDADTKEKVLTSTCHKGVHRWLEWSSPWDARSLLNVPVADGLRLLQPPYTHSPTTTTTTTTTSPTSTEPRATSIIDSVDTKDNVCLSWRDGHAQLLSESESESEAAKSAHVVPGTTFWWRCDVCDRWEEHMMQDGNADKPDGDACHSATPTPTPTHQPQQHAHHILHDHFVTVASALHSLMHTHHVHIGQWLLGSGYPVEQHQPSPTRANMTRHGVGVGPGPSLSHDPTSPFPSRSCSSSSSSHSRVVLEWYHLLQRAWLGPAESGQHIITIPPHWRNKHNSSTAGFKSTTPTHAHTETSRTSAATSSPAVGPGSGSGSSSSRVVCFARLMIPRIVRTPMWPFNEDGGNGSSLLSEAALPFTSQHVATLRHNMASILGLHMPLEARTKLAQAQTQAQSQAQAHTHTQTQAPTSRDFGADVPVPGPFRVVICAGSGSSHRWLNGGDVLRGIAPHHYVTLVSSSLAVSAQDMIRLMWSTDIYLVAHGYPQIMATLFLPPQAIVLQTQGILSRPGLGGFLDVLSLPASASASGVGARVSADVWSSLVLGLSVQCGVSRDDQPGLWQSRDEEDYTCMVVNHPEDKKKHPQFLNGILTVLQHTYHIDLTTL